MHNLSLSIDNNVHGRQACKVSPSLNESSGYRTAPIPWRGGDVEGRRREIPLWVLPCYHVLMFTTRSDTAGAVSDMEEFCISVPLVKHHRPMPKRQKILNSCHPVHMVCKFLFLNFRSAPFLNFSTMGAS
jgi:hypothetical protein